MRRSSNRDHRHINSARPAPYSPGHTASALDSRAPSPYRQSVISISPRAEGQMFLETVAEKDAIGAIAEVYRKEKAHAGFVPESARCMTTRPDLLPLFDAFFDGVRGGFSLGARE